MTDHNAARKELSLLLKKAGYGDRNAFGQIYNLTSAKLFGICVRILNDREAAEDVLQEAYIKIWNNAGRFDAKRASPITWLATIARNSAIDRRRSGSGRQMISDDILSEIASGETSALEQMQDKEDANILNKCLDSLEARQSRVIRTAFFEGRSYKELAQALNTPLGTVKSWVRRGLQRLKDCIDDG